jgi:hypothetical protein
VDHFLTAAEALPFVPKDEDAMPLTSENLRSRSVPVATVRFGDLIEESDKGRQAAKWCERMAFAYAPHSARFFSMLFEIMRSRGHDPSPGSTDFSLYFG